MSITRRNLLAGVGAGAIVMAAPLRSAWAQSKAEFSYKYANNLPLTHPMNIRAKEMADAPIYLNPSNPQNQINWGQRVYFYNAVKEGAAFAWLKNNLETAKGNIKPATITLDWLFGGKWMPYLGW